MSIILRPEVLHFKNPTSVTAFAAVSVCEAIESISKKAPKIKWVNDIFLDGKKVCGILTEAVTDFESGGLDWIVLGIGINVHMGNSFQRIWIRWRETYAGTFKAVQFDIPINICYSFLNKRRN